MPPPEQEPSVVTQFVSEIAARAREGVAAVLDPMLIRSATAALGRGLLAGAQELAAEAQRTLTEISQSLPSNFDALTIPQIGRLLEIMGATGWSLLWTPGHSALIALLDAKDDGARKTVLLRAEVEIIHDLRRLLDNVEDTALADPKRAAREALESHVGGLTLAAQALSAATLTSVAQDYFNHRNVREARRAFRRLAEDEAAARQLRLSALLSAAACALEGYDPTGRQRRRNFNRSESLHRVSTPQYAPANSLTALMLLVSMIVEAQSLDELFARAAVRRSNDS